MSKAKDWRGKFYGTITGGQLEGLLAEWSENWDARAALFSDTAELEMWLQKLANVPNWVGLYQRPLPEVLGLVAIVTNTVSDLQAAAVSDDKIEAVGKVIESIPNTAPDHPLAMPLAWVLWANLEAVARYSRTINEMLAASVRGDKKAFFDALSVDSQIVSLPECLASLRLGQLVGDQSFAEEVFKSISGPHKARLVYPKLRWAAYMLRDQGAFEACSQDEIYELIVQRLKLYGGDSEHKDAKKSLFMLFREWRKQAGN